MDVNARDVDGGLTALMWAARMGHEAVVKQLLDESRVDRNCKDIRGKTALSFSIEDRAGKVLHYYLRRALRLISPIKR